MPSCKWILSIIGMLLIGACAVQDGKQQFKSIPAPTRDGVAIEITSADNGATLDLQVGTLISVTLRGVPTAGYIWTVAERPDFLAAAGTAGGATSEAQLEPGFSGGSHWEVFFFNVTSEGAGELRLEQRRPWETDEPPASEFSVTLSAVRE